jgi:hypothetical protein
MESVRNSPFRVRIPVGAPKFLLGCLWQTENMTVSEAFAKFRQDLIDLIKKHQIAKPDPRWDESDILKAFTEYLYRTAPSPEELARAAYNGYRNHTGGKSLATGQTIPEWEQLRPDIQEAWRASRDHLMRELYKQRAGIV